jgi:DNA-binding transcriptional MerR regulator
MIGLMISLLIHKNCFYNDSSSDLIDCMKTETPSSDYPLADLCALADLPIRTARYYIQIGLVDKPSGSTRAAVYGPRHLEQLLLIKKWTAAGVSLERIRELLHGAEAPVPPRPFVAGSVEVRSHLTVADGVEVVIEPGRAGLSPEQVRRFTRAVMTAFESINTSPKSASADTEPSQQQEQLP